ncbi:hypothetical protein ABIB40_003461 [Pedobacter sp. UYP30]|uniref:hypothetical protein n=1 Tax=Pedobacter sp. UYP30 TaxID=1756400 RepID=UPI003391D011
MNLHFQHLPNNFLLSLLQEPGFSEALAYLVDFKNYTDLKIIPKAHSIELSNTEIVLSIIIYSGFELNEHAELSGRKNVHLVCFSNVIPEMLEFKGMHIKYVDKLAWFFTIMSTSKVEYVQKLNLLRNLRID